jgi:hypothetical protein
MQQRGKDTSATIVTVGNSVMQPVARQQQQLDYNNGKGDVLYVVLADELS